MPILSNLLLKIRNNILFIISNDTEIEIISKIELILNIDKSNESITVSGKKFFDIFKMLPEDSEIEIAIKNEQMFIRTPNICFTLSTISSINFPCFEKQEIQLEIEIYQKTLKKLIEYTYFSMASQDIRHYLNGMLFVVESKKIYTVATDGHRLAVCSFPLLNEKNSKCTIIIPRKSVIELMKLINENKELIKLKISNQYICIHTNDFIFTSKLIDVSFPNYKNVLLTKLDKEAIIDLNKIKNSCLRSSILLDTKFKCVSLEFYKNTLEIRTKNFKNEQYIEKIIILYKQENITINVNPDYILDILNALKINQVHLFLKDSNSCIKIKHKNEYQITYVIMPMIL
ncbi:MAG: DNA polymerase III subunit beta [Arsenophonus sp.]|nr:MAG: DNA polymerase III subunit beta [Arsenophonus sp.]